MSTERGKSGLSWAALRQVQVANPNRRANEAVEKLMLALQMGKPFKGVLVPVATSGLMRWWSITGKPRRAGRQGRRAFFPGWLEIRARHLS